ncbi:hypothetical protein VTK56DRAFT_3183 [Thermocarpiscus australiensis]
MGHSIVPSKVGRMMIDPSIRLRQATHANDALLARRILESLPHLLYVGSNYINHRSGVAQGREFLKENNPEATSVIWIGLLFAVMCLAAQFQLLHLKPGLGPARMPPLGALELYAMNGHF